MKKLIDKAIKCYQPRVFFHDTTWIMEELARIIVMNRYLDYVNVCDKLKETPQDYYSFIKTAESKRYGFLDLVRYIFYSFLNKW